MGDLSSDIKSCSGVTPPSYSDFGKELDASENFWAEQRRQVELNRERRKDIDWFDSCRPDDRD